MFTAFRCVDCLVKLSKYQKFWRNYCPDLQAQRSFMLKSGVTGFVWNIVTCLPCLWCHIWQKIAVLRVESWLTYCTDCQTEWLAGSRWILDWLTDWLMVCNNKDPQYTLFWVSQIHSTSLQIIFLLFVYQLLFDQLFPPPIRPKGLKVFGSKVVYSCMLHVQFVIIVHITI